MIQGRRSGMLADAPFKSPLYPLMPIVTLMALGYIFWLNWLDVEEGRPGLLMTGAQVLLSGLYYLLVLRLRGTWDVHVPDLGKATPV